MMPPPPLHRLFAIALATMLLALVAGCAAVTTLSHVVQPPRFEQAVGQHAEIRLLAPSRAQPAGGATIRLWMKVINLNAFALTVSMIRTTLLLEENQAASADFPLELPLGGGQESVVPLDLTVALAGLPGLSGVVRRGAKGLPVEYRLDGTVGVHAGQLGQSTFGPMTLMVGEITARGR